jgi:hypothetical protein
MFQIQCFNEKLKGNIRCRIVHNKKEQARLMMKLKKERSNNVENYRDQCRQFIVEISIV